MEPLVSVKEFASRVLALELKSDALGAVKKDAKVLTMEVARAELRQVEVGALNPRQEQALLYRLGPPQAEA